MINNIVIFTGKQLKMSRPKPTILKEFTDFKKNRRNQILLADAIYAVFYDGKPINVRNFNYSANFKGPKYKQVSFSNKGHAFNLSERLNELYKTDNFEVVKLLIGEIVTENVE